MEPKQYRLLQWYPSLPSWWEEGDIVQRTSGTRNHYEVENKVGTRPKEEIENNPEFWELVVEKDYKILRYHDGHNIYYKKQDGKWTINLQYDYTEEQLLNKKVDIHSVKRLSDGEVFTVGDKIESVKEYSFDTTNTIKRFTVDNKGHLFVILDNRNESSYSTKGSFNCFKHVKNKQPIFTTEDGVDIYEGDKCYSIVNWEPFEHNFDKYSVKGMIAADRKKYFSTKEKAKEWIDNNKPKYSKNDVRKMVDKSLDLYPRIICSKEYEYIINLNKLKEQLSD